jgi:hypothetical protein
MVQDLSRALKVIGALWRMLSAEPPFQRAPLDFIGERLPAPTDGWTRRHLTNRRQS